MKPIFKKVIQIAIAVKDLDKAVRTYADGYGIGPWSIRSFNPGTVKDMIRNDKRVDHRYRTAIAYIGDMEMELMEPLDDKSIYAEFIKEHGEGIHHLAYQVEDYDKAMEFFRNKGLFVTQQGNWFGKLIYTYLSTEKDLKHGAEILKTEGPVTYPEPDEIYPPEGKENKIMKPIFKKVIQIAIAVKDLDKAVRTYADGYGIGPWSIRSFNPGTVKDMIRNDKRVDHRYRTAIAYIGDMEMELMEPLDDKSIYAEFIKEHGEGIHHLAYQVEDYDKAMEFFRNKGLFVTQQGNWFGKLIYTYLSTEKDLKHGAEILKTEGPVTYPEPDEIYPPE